MDNFLDRVLAWVEKASGIGLMQTEAAIIHLHKGILEEVPEILRDVNGAIQYKSSFVSSTIAS